MTDGGAGDERGGAAVHGGDRAAPSLEETVPAGAPHALEMVPTMAAGSDGAPDEMDEAGSLARGTLVGRYVVLGRLGAGAMGVVHGAYDPELDRKVALKLLHPDAGGSSGQAQLLREAQALARLSHPNVVAVHDVGVLEDRGGQVYLAMAFVDGVSLRQWIHDAPRGWREVLRVMIQAGRGLAAAHAQGLVHRDFKPDNVMVTADGRTLVMDFGLARLVDREEGAEGSPPGGRAEVEPVDARETHGSALARPLTGVGALVGTPGYMAPEQFEGGQVDARTDQFAYCVTLWEALYGERPFAGESVAAMAFAVTRGKVRRPPRGKNVPGWLRRVCLRGLAVRPEDRFADMDALLAALVGRRARSRVLRGVVAAGVLAVAAGGVEVAHRLDHRSRVQACEAKGASIFDLWNATARARVRRALLATSLPYAPHVTDEVLPFLDRVAEGWSRSATDVCVAVEADERWAPAMAQRAAWCLEDARLEFVALVERLSEADTSAVERAVPAAAALVGRAAACRDPAALARLPDPPDDVDAEEIQRVRELVSGGFARLQLGAYDEGIELANRALDRSEALGWPPLVARARSLLGAMQAKAGRLQDAEPTLIQAYFEAAEAGAWKVAGDTAIMLAFAVGRGLGRREEGMGWVRHAEIALDLAGVSADGLERASLESVRAVLLAEAGLDDRAVRHIEWALKTRESRLGAEHPSVVASLNTLANLEWKLGNLERARRLHERALEIARKVHGPRHPATATSLNNLGLVYEAMGDREAAVQAQEEALAIKEKILGGDHPDVAKSMHNLAHALVEVGAWERAGDLFGRALAILEARLGPDHPHVASALMGLARVALHRRKPEEAARRAARALAIREATKAPAVDLAESHFVLARALWQAPAGGGGDRARARREAEAARDLYRGLKGQDRARAEVEAWLVDHPIAP